MSPSFAIFLSLFLSCATCSQIFLVHVENNIKPFGFSVEYWYSSILKNLTIQTRNRKEIIHVYRTVFHGFSASLTPEQAEELEQRREILGVIPDQILQLQTTRSPEFLGLVNCSQLQTLSDFGSNVTVGLLDSGIWPERESFNDQGLGPIPSHWKGECNGGEDFPKTLCNKKLIGVRYFKQEARDKKLSARDTMGHGTHTASTAAGRAVQNASFFGYAEGDATGIAPKARLAMYKVCWPDCQASDVLAAFDKATEDGVDVLSVSMGELSPTPHYLDPFSIASFGAMEKGVVVVASAGNSGYHGTVVNVAPWVTTVGASSIDRAFPADLLLGDGTVITGASLYPGNSLPRWYFPLFDGSQTHYCKGDNTTSGESVRGKIVVCEYSLIDNAVGVGLRVEDSGGVGIILSIPLEHTEALIPEAYLIPGLIVTASSGEKIFKYIRSVKNPQATMVFRGTQLGIKPAPALAYFSSRGPNPLSSYVVKPDVIAPGVEILAGYPDGIAPTGSDRDTRRTKFNIMSGTSMACPHVSGISALLKGAHPDWSPAMIKSALMTTAYTHDQDGNPLLDNTDMKEANVWGIGAGHVDPQKALDPGLVYDLATEDYLDFLCASNHSLRQIHMITRKLVNCSLSKIKNPWDLNYPNIAVDFNTTKSSSSEVVVTRTVMQVADDGFIYKVNITNPEDVTVTVDPHELVFKNKGEKQTYKVRIQSNRTWMLENDNAVFGRLVWTDEKHNVSSAIVVTFST